MNLRSLWSSLRDKPTSDALDYITKRINLIWTREHNGETGGHRFPLTLWTPTFGGTGGESGQVYAAQHGYALKAGQLVFVSYRVQLSTLGTITGTVQVKGFPYASLTATNFRVRNALNWANLATAFGFVQWQMNEGVTNADIAGTTAAATSGPTLLTQANLTSTTLLAGSGIYLTDE